jgi:hypothetical protein
VNTILVVLVVKLMNQLVVLSFMSDVDYKFVGNFMTTTLAKIQHMCMFLRRVMRVLFQFGLLSKQLT